MATLNSRAQSAPSPGTAPLIILVMIAVVIIFYVLTVSPEERESLIGKVNVPGITFPEKALINVNPGLILGIAESELVRTSHILALFTIDNTPQAQTKALVTQFLVKRSLTKDTPAEMSFIISDKTILASANLEMLVNDRKENGELVVTLNDKAVYNARVNAGQKLIVALPVDSIVKGENNIKIYAAGAGIKFWATNSYLLSDINLVTYSYTGTEAVKTQTIILSKEEFAGARYAKLSAFIKQMSESSAKVTIMLNGDEIYGSIPKTDSFAIEIPASKLHNTNTLQWSVARGGKYDVEFGRFMVLSSEKNAKIKTYSFNVLQSEYLAASTGNLDCILRVTQENDTVSGADLMDVGINGVTNSYYFSNYKIEEDVCSMLIAGSNTLELSATEDVTIDNMKLTIESK